MITVPIDFRLSSVKPTAITAMSRILRAFSEGWVIAILGMDAKYDIEVSMLSDVGCRRSRNEDRVLILRPPGDPERDHRGLLAVIADGMGGHVGGEIASQIAVDTIGQAYFQQVGDNPIEALKASFVSANQAIHDAASREPSLLGMGTTCTALAIWNNQACFAHVGDSRLYRLRDGALTLLTSDHTMVMELVRVGLLTPDAARHHRDRSIITRALGILPEVEISTAEEPWPLEPGDVYLLCSDGLYDLVEDEEIRQTLVSLAPQAACEQLIALAKKRGGFDNISVAILAVRAQA
jgi:protein phosphatase